MGKRFRILLALLFTQSFALSGCAVFFVSPMEGHEDDPPDWEIEGDWQINKGHRASHRWLFDTMNERHDEEPFKQEIVYRVKVLTPGPRRGRQPARTWGIEGIIVSQAGERPTTKHRFRLVEAGGDVYAVVFDSSAAGDHTHALKVYSVVRLRLVEEEMYVESLNKDRLKELIENHAELDRIRHAKSNAMIVNASGAAIRDFLVEHREDEQLWISEGVYHRVAHPQTQPAKRDNREFQPR